MSQENVETVGEGKISRIRIFLDRDEAPKALGLEE
jgi:ketosteroid isomerase-like protein